jgi:hypothetical protein
MGAPCTCEGTPFSCSQGSHVCEVLHSFQEIVAGLCAGEQHRVDYEFQSSHFPLEGLVEYSTIVEDIKPIYGPCVTTPLPWVAPNRGCYSLCLGDHSFVVDMMRTKSPLQSKLLLRKHGAALASRARSTRMTSAESSAQPHAEPEPTSAVDDDGEHAAGLWPVFQALNVLGSQGWCINRNVLRVRPPRLSLCVRHMQLHM